ncbi:ATP-binding protein [Streptomyces griseoaurantiacus]|uniref:ATP-binding protein n=1 Tax=Streptomyces griseoaurantiacus TaxID=68213 RepID=UPI002E2C6F8C|nr:ATP-binding protein [Streptomyces jietaisiensis]
MSAENSRTGDSAAAAGPAGLRFSVPLSATRRGARLARLLAAEQFAEWGVPPDPAQLIVAELAANAALHGRVPGRGFRLTLTLATPWTLRIELTDRRGERMPEPGRRSDESPGESGHGLSLVEELATRWGVRVGPPPSKTVWAELDLARGTAPLRGPRGGRTKG